MQDQLYLGPEGSGSSFVADHSLFFADIAVKTSCLVIICVHKSSNKFLYVSRRIINRAGQVLDGVSHFQICLLFGIASIRICETYMI